MQIATIGSYPLTIGWLIGLLVLILAILGLAAALPFNQTVIFGLIAALAIARLT